MKSNLFLKLIWARLTGYDSPRLYLLYLINGHFPLVKWIIIIEHHKKRVKNFRIFQK